MAIIENKSVLPWPFTVTEGSDTFTDALHMTLEQRSALSDNELAALQMARFNNWKAAVAEMSARVPVPPTSDEIQTQIDALTQQQRDMQDQLIRLAPGDVMLGILQAQAQIIADQIAALGA